VSTNLTRFYYDFDDECRTGCLTQLAFEDIETIEANQFEAKLKDQDIPYLRVDF